MIIVKISRKLLNSVILIVLVGFLGFSIYSYKCNKELTNKYTLQDCGISQLDTADLTAFLASTAVSAQDHKNIEIFDISKGEVIQKSESNSEIQKEVVQYLKGITGMYVKVKAFPDKGYIIRIPLEPSVMVQSQWLTDYGINFVDEIFILFPEQGKPYLLVLDEKRRPLFYNFEGNTAIVLKNLSFQPP